MPTASSPSTSKRLLALLSLLQSRRDWPAPVLAGRLEVSERTVRRDIDRLRELDYVIDATRGPDGGYRLGAGSQLPPLLFDDEQVIALALALRTAGGLGAGIDEAADRALRTVSRLMPERLSHRVANLVDTVGPAATRGSVQTDPAVLLSIGEAIRTRRELRFDYATPDRAANAAAPAVRSVEPHHLLAHNARWYLIAYSPAEDEWRIYRADRITPRTHTGRSFTARSVPGGDPARYLSARFKGSTSSTAEDVWPCTGTATVHGPLSTIAPYVADGSAEAIGADRCRVRLGSWSWEALAAEFCRFTFDVSDVEPPALRAAFTSIAERTRRAGAGEGSGT
ncbi:YafY family protein [Agreia sp. Leaf283]|uniref:helix-turn-helix transcriptional regulator n=1 Tax=Agreia sp. Leaf283 TaxID=1736321 RepID=UPI0006F6D3AF|nr:WYL domain-containing protein [Agreia sp. Leaf283]KQP56823.1 transcriptional regulator [Agreia sp. Leaf283]